MLMCWAAATVVVMVHRLRRAGDKPLGIPDVLEPFCGSTAVYRVQLSAQDHHHHHITPKPRVALRGNRQQSAKQVKRFETDRPSCVGHPGVLFLLDKGKNGEASSTPAPGDPSAAAESAPQSGFRGTTFFSRRPRRGCRGSQEQRRGGRAGARMRVSARSSAWRCTTAPTTRSHARPHTPAYHPPQKGLARSLPVP